MTNIRTIPCNAWDQLPFEHLPTAPSGVAVALKPDGIKDPPVKVPGPEYLLDPGQMSKPLCGGGQIEEQPHNLPC